MGVGPQLAPLSVFIWWPCVESLVIPLLSMPGSELRHIWCNRECAVCTGHVVTENDFRILLLKRKGRYVGLQLSSCVLLNGVLT